MEPNQNMYRPQSATPMNRTTPMNSTTPAASIAPAPKPEAPVQNMMAQASNAKKKGKGALLGMVFLGMLAVAGISFGVWEMMSANQQKADMSSQIDTLKQQNSTLQDKITELQATIQEYENSTINNSGATTEVLPPEKGTAEAVIENNVFTIKNANGETFLKSEEVVADEIISCNPGVNEVPATLVCLVKTPTGEVEFTYNYDERSLEFVETTK